MADVAGDLFLALQVMLGDTILLPGYIDYADGYLPALFYCERLKEACA